MITLPTPNVTVLTKTTKSAITHSLNMSETLNLSHKMARVSLIGANIKLGQWEGQCPYLDEKVFLKCAWYNTPIVMLIFLQWRIHARVCCCYNTAKTRKIVFTFSNDYPFNISNDIYGHKFLLLIKIS